MESIKKKYYKLSSKEFNKYIDSIKNDSETIVLFKKLDKQYYFKMDNELYNALLDLHLKQICCRLIVRGAAPVLSGNKTRLNRTFNYLI